MPFQLPHSVFDLTVLLRAYGLTADEVAEDPALASRRQQLMASAARQLHKFDMITWDEDTGAIAPTEVGFLAAKYYLRSVDVTASWTIFMTIVENRAASIEKFNEIFKANMTEADFLWVLSESTEFAQVAVRDSEITELDQLQEKVPCQIKVRTSVARL